MEDSDCSAKATKKTANKTLIICTIRPIWQHYWQPICLHLRKICSIYFAAKKVTLSRWTCTTRQQTEHTYLPPPVVTLDFWKDERFKMESAPNDSEWHIKESSPGPLQTGWDSSTHKIWLLHWCHKHLEVAALLALNVQVVPLMQVTLWQVQGISLEAAFCCLPKQPKQVWSGSWTCSFAALNRLWSLEFADGDSTVAQVWPSLLSLIFQ